MPIETTLNARVPVKVWTDRIELAAMQQLKNTASLPFVFKHVAAMADVHLGIGATVGSVVATRGAVCPAAVGVDIGCSMMARKTSIPADRLDAASQKALRHSIEREIPVGFGRAKSAEKKMAESLPDPDLAYFVAGTPEFREYREDVEWCQGYARQNREIMMDRILRPKAALPAKRAAGRSG
jgi:RNA-splicing ligase RtcB